MNHSLQPPDAVTRRSRTILLVILGILVVWVFADVRRRGRLDANRPEVHRTDLTAYTSAANVWWNGGTSDEAFAAASPRGWRYQYLPFFGTLMGPLSLFGTQTQSFLFGLFGVALAFGVFVESRRLIHLFFSSGLDPPGWIAACAATAFAFPMLNTIQRGQVGLLVVYPLMLGFRLMYTSRPTAGGVALAFPAILKILPTLSAGSILIATVAPVLRTRDRDVVHRAIKSVVGFLMGCLLFLLIVPALLIGWQNNLDGIRYFLEHVVLNPNFARDWGFDIHSIRNQSLAGAVWQLTDTAFGGLGRGHDATTEAGHPFDLTAVSTATSIARWLILAFFLATIVRLATAWRSLGDPRIAAVIFGLSCAATLVFSPVAWGHHFVQGLPAWIAIPAWLYVRGGGRTAWAFAITPPVLVLAHYILMSWAGPLGVLGVGTTVWLLFACFATWAEASRLNR